METGDKRQLPISDDDDFILVTKSRKTANHTAPKAAPARTDLDHNRAGNESTSTEVRSSSNDVIIVASEDQSCIFIHPQKTSDALNSSVFHKHIVEGTCRILGKGAAMRFEVTSQAKLPDLSLISELGQPGTQPWKIRCWRPQSISNEYSYGRILPVDPTMSEAEIKKSLRLLDHSLPNVIEVKRFTKSRENGGGPTSTVRLKFKGSLPNKVCMGFTCFSVLPHKFPILRCYNCHSYGHGRLTCRNRLRCSNCSAFHESNNCTNAPSCYFCQGPHKPTSRACPIYKNALDLEQQMTDGSLNTNSFNIALRKLNPLSKKNPSNNIQIPETNSLVNNTSPPPISQPLTLGQASGTGDSQPPAHQIPPTTYAAVVQGANPSSLNISPSYSNVQSTQSITTQSHTSLKTRKPKPQSPFQNQSSSSPPWFSSAPHSNTQTNYQPPSNTTIDNPQPLSHTPTDNHQPPSTWPCHSPNFPPLIRNIPQPRTPTQQPPFSWNSFLTSLASLLIPILPKLCAGCSFSEILPLIIPGLLEILSSFSI